MSIKTWIPALLLALAACAGTGEARRDIEKAVPGLSDSRTGVITAVQGDQLAVYDPAHADTDPIWVRRTADTKLVQEDRPVNWDALTEGTPVRVSFEAEAGAERAMRIEVLTGAEGEQVKTRVGTVPPAPPSPGSSRPGTVTPMDRERTRDRDDGQMKDRPSDY